MRKWICFTDKQGSISREGKFSFCTCLHFDKSCLVLDRLRPCHCTFSCANFSLSTPRSVRMYIVLGDNSRPFIFNGRHIDRLQWITGRICTSRVGFSGLRKGIMVTLRQLRTDKTINPICNYLAYSRIMNEAREAYRSKLCRDQCMQM